MWVKSPFHQKSWLGQLLVIGIFVLAIPLIIEWTHSIGYPISGEHNHRQADTFSVALNFLDHPNFFYPRVHHTYGRTGIHGMEAPIIPYTASLWMRLLGKQEWLGRLNTVLYFFLGILALSLYFRMSPGPHSFWIPLSILFFSPMTLFYSRQIQPDIPMVCIGLMALYLALRSRRRRWPSLLVATLVFAIGALSKYPLLFVWPAFVVAAVRWHSLSWRGRVGRFALTCIPLLFVGIWMIWASYLERRFAFGLPQYFAATPKPSEIWNNVKSFNLGHAVGYLLPKYAITYTFFPIVIYGLLLSFQRKYREWAAPLWCWMLGALLLVLMFTTRLNSHNYYAMLYIPPIWLFGALGLHRIWLWLRYPQFRREDGNFQESAQEVPWVLGIWVALYLTQQPWGWSQGVALIAGCLYLGISTLKQRHANSLQEHIRPLLVVGITLFLVSVSLKASQAKLHERCTRLGAPVSFTLRAQALRTLLQGRVKPDEPIVIIATYNPWFLHAANRKGWTHYERSLFHGNRGLRYYRQRGVRWIVVSRRVTHHTPRILRGIPLTAQAQEWQLYNIEKSKH